MKVIIEHSKTRELRKVDRVVRGGKLDVNGWKWFTNQGDHLIAFSSPWEEIAICQ
jgi:hypothetical protein